jgi:hypothetical protein
LGRSPSEAGTPSRLPWSEADWVGSRNVPRPQAPRNLSAIVGYPIALSEGLGPITHGMLPAHVDIPASAVRTDETMVAFVGEPPDRSSGLGRSSGHMLECSFSSYGSPPSWRFSAWRQGWCAASSPNTPPSSPSRAAAWSAPHPSQAVLEAMRVGLSPQPHSTTTLSGRQV